MTRPHRCSQGCVNASLVVPLACPKPNRYTRLTSTGFTFGHCAFGTEINGWLLCCCCRKAVASILEATIAACQQKMNLCFYTFSSTTSSALPPLCHTSCTTLLCWLAACACIWQAVPPGRVWLLTESARFNWASMAAYRERQVQRQRQGTNWVRQPVQDEEAMSRDTHATPRTKNTRAASTHSRLYAPAKYQTNLPHRPPPPQAEARPGPSGSLRHLLERPAQGTRASCTHSPCTRACSCPAARSR
jgi:hypothetical protein